MTLRFKADAFPFVAVAAPDVNVTTIEGTDATDALEAAAAAAIAAAGLSAPGGTYAQTVTVTTGTPAVAVQGATVEIREADGTLVDIQTTNASGVATPTCDAGTYSLVVSKSSLYASSTAEITVTSAAARSVTLSAIGSVPSPSSDLQCTGYSYVYDEDGNVESGVSIVCRLVREPTGGGIIVENAERTEASGAGGLVTFEQLWIGGTYEFRRSGSTVRKPVTIAADDVDSLGRFPIPNFRG
jgi:hypothetical protein